VKIKYWLGDGSLLGHTRNEVIDRLKSMLRNWESFCDVTFTQVEEKRNSNIATWFVGAESMRAAYRGEGTPLGLGWRNGTVWLNKDRNVSSRWVVENLFAHEWMHTLSWKHIDDVNCVMSPNISARFWCRSEVLWMQKHWGKKSVTKWYPLDRAFWGVLHNEIKDMRDTYISARDSSTDKAFRTIQQNRNLALLPEQIEYATEWFKANDYWKGVYGV
jgi:hypothetical protein